MISSPVLSLRAMQHIDLCLIRYIQFIQTIDNELQEKLKDDTVISVIDKPIIVVVT